MPVCRQWNEGCRLRGKHGISLARQPCPAEIMFLAALQSRWCPAWHSLQVHCHNPKPSRPSGQRAFFSGYRSWLDRLRRPRRTTRIRDRICTVALCEMHSSRRPEPILPRWFLLERRQKVLLSKNKSKAAGRPRQDMLPGGNRDGCNGFQTDASQDAFGPVHALRRRLSPIRPGPRPSVASVPGSGTSANPS